ncbi:putative CDP-diacylglycerol-serine O-phosphatidyltransferase [Sphingobacterium spiritivorum ATCC 33300]|uniref:Putative CDP-diacylglycerol-serine O-phosphatidyltransferase n=2 Tax=Sphingobacterium spiritivorum TaxID=258 RepID=C2G5L0_SPHSI|nr:putative CDP-diacylglycerol-serine O-phosphatidyltransferase [Sphingobacterium spiritivorum ATCC 33300]QQS94546.1 CDP-alcohol phosphatidyltransferase family protein [Sphingobacterium spiritivorum]
MAFLVIYYMKKYIPNTLTCLNLFSGCVGVLFALKGEFQYTFYCVLFSGICDFFDGMAARALHVKSTIGKELDSLADMISFGFLPGAVIYFLLKEINTEMSLLPYLAFVMTVFSGLRLAKFNVDERQSTDFIGLNTPMNTFYIISLPFIAQIYPEIIMNNVFLLITVAVSSTLLVSELRLFSMKLSSLSWKVNQFKYLFLILSVVLLALLKFLAIPFILLAYIVFSIIHFRTIQQDKG